MHDIDSEPRPAPAELAALHWRLLALLYDSLPVLALWIFASALILTLRGGVRIEPWSGAFWLQNLLLWLLTGGYAVLSWRHGGQTLGMRPWRLRVVAADGGSPALSRLWLRYLAAHLSLLAGGLGFLWSGLDRDRRTWHDRWSRTALVRMPKPTR